MKGIDFDTLAIYIVHVAKKRQQGINYAIDMVVWYTMTEAQDNEVIDRIKKIW